MSFVSRNLERASSRINRIIGSNWGERFPIYYVCEHPRAGGTWLADLVADYMQIPFPKNNVFPLGCSGVIHNHWGYAPNLRRVAYVYRDGRDVAVSTYFYVTRSLRLGGDPGVRAYIARRFSYLARPGVDLDDIGRWLPRFIGDWARRPFGCSIGWGDHVLQWTLSSSGVVAVSYESLRREPVATLSRVIEGLTHSPAERVRVEESVAKFSFERQTGRRPGQADPSSAKRNGVVGDWKNYFTRETGQLFERHFGDALVALGYENRTDWWESLPSDPLAARHPDPVTDTPNRVEPGRGLAELAAQASNVSIDGAG